MRRAPGTRSGPRSPSTLAYAGGAVAAVRDSLDGLVVDTERMRANMTDDLYAEQRALGLDGDYLGSAEAFVDRVLDRYRA